MNEIPNTVGDQSAFWQRQRELAQGRIEPMEPVKAPRHTPIWLWMIAVPLSLVALISIARGVF